MPFHQPDPPLSRDQVEEVHRTNTCRELVKYGSLRYYRVPNPGTSAPLWPNKTRLTRPKLDTLPVEIIQEIVRYTGDETLWALRHTSVAITAKTAHAFGRRFFESITVAPAFSGSAQFVKDLGHHDWNIHIRQLVFSTDLYGHKYRDVLTDEDVRANARSILDSSRLFPNLENIVIADFEDTWAKRKYSTKPYGMRRLRANQWYCKLQLGRPRVFETILRLCIEQEWRRATWKLDVCLDVCFWDQTPEELCNWIASVDQIRSTSLMLNLENPESCLIATATKTEVLSLDFNYSLYGSGWDEPVPAPLPDYSSTDAQSLRKLRVHKARVQDWKIVRMLSQQTCTEIELVEIISGFDGSLPLGRHPWKDIWMAMLQLPHLQRLRLSRNATVRRFHWAPTDAELNEAWRGRNEIICGLQELIRYHDALLLAGAWTVGHRLAWVNMQRPNKKVEALRVAQSSDLWMNEFWSMFE